MRKIAAILPLLALSACAPSQWSPVVETIVNEKKAASDAEAALVVRAPCMMTFGAWARLEAKSDRDAISLLCGGR